MDQGLIRNFHAWLDQTFAGGIPTGIVAFNVNLYDYPFSAEVVGSTFFDPDDDDWACEEAWTPNRENRFDFPQERGGLPWAQRLAEIEALLRQWMSTERVATAKLLDAEAFAVGFVDGDLTVLRQRTSRMRPD